MLVFYASNDKISSPLNLASADAFNLDQSIKFVVGKELQIVPTLVQCYLFNFFHVPILLVLST